MGVRRSLPHSIPADKIKIAYYQTKKIKGLQLLVCNVILETKNIFSTNA
jgi:hypothetical protein